MIELAERLGAAGLATGHYARLVDDGDGPAADRRRRPGQGPDLHARRRCRRRLLARLRFPLGELSKPEVREIAADAGLPVADKAESQDLCFLAGEGKAGFLARHGGLADRAGRDRRRRRAASLGGHAATTASPSASAAGSASPRRSRST